MSGIKSTVVVAPGIGISKKGEGKKNISNFLITLNPNKRFPEEEWSRRGDILRQMGQVIIGENLGELITFPKGGEWTERYIQETSTYVRTEVGDKRSGNRLHLHIIVKVVHNSFIRLNMEETVRRCNEWLDENGGEDMHIAYGNVRAGQKDWSDYLKEGETV